MAPEAAGTFKQIKMPLSNRLQSGCDVMLCTVMWCHVVYCGVVSCSMVIRL